jgi:DNA-directed RNA polymerase subunit RPC12/RpoP
LGYQSKAFWAIYHAIACSSALFPRPSADAFRANRSGEVSEAAQMVEVKRQKKILNALQTQGKLSLSEAAIEVDASLDQIKQDIYDLVGKGLFSGYIDWQDGILYSRQARQLRGAGACPNCGGKLELAGKGIIKCPYCASDIFI